MRIDLDLRFDELFCIVPNEDPDEPYLWTFFLKLDGETVRQPFPNALSLEGHVQVFSAPGSHGNLNATGVSSQRSIPIPPHIGAHATTLRPIWITHLGQTIAVPGQFIAVAAILEEDASPDSGIENGHQNLRAWVEQRVNEFISSIDIGEVVAAGPDPAATVNQRFQALIDEVKSSSRQIVVLEVMAAHAPGAIWEADKDDTVGSLTFRFDERQLVNDPGAMHQLLTDFAIEANEEEGQIESMYRLRGNLDVSVHPERLDVQNTSATITTTVGDVGNYTFAESRPCINAGPIEWVRHDQVEEESFLFQYPFLPVIWKVDGKPMSLPSGEVTLTKECTFPLFDPAIPGLGYRTETREVIVKYTAFAVGPRPGIRLRNRPEDGSYDAQLQAVVLLGPPVITLPRPELAVATIYFGFDGQAITSPFFEQYDDCIERAFGYKKSKRVGPKELWGPSARKRWLERQVRLGKRLLEAGIIKGDVFDAGVRVLQQRLRLPNRER